MTDTAVDVNEAFAAERRATMEWAAGADQRYADRLAAFQERVAKGELEDLGNGSFRSLQQYDMGEVWTVSRETGLAMPQHQLDESKGSVALYTRVPAWHEFGNVVPEGVTNVEEVMVLGGLNYGVEKVPVEYTVPSSFRTLVSRLRGDRQRFVPRLEVEDQFVNFRTDTGAALGVVGKDFTIIQNADAFSFLQELTDKGELVWESVGATKGGAHVFVSVRLPEDITVDAGGINDQIRPFVVLLNGHDGSLKLTAAVTPWRPVCGNTERFAVRDAHTRWTVRHTRNASARVDEAARTLKLSNAFYANFAKEETRLARNDMLLDEFVKLTAEIFEPKKDPSDREKALEATRTEFLVRRFREEAGRVGLSAYAAERAVTGYLDNDKTRRASSRYGTAAQVRAATSLEGGDDETKDRVHRKLMLRLAA